MPTSPTRDKTQEMIDIALRVRHAGFRDSDFTTVYDAIIRVEYPEGVTVVVNQTDISQETARAIEKRLSKAMSGRL